MLEIRRVNLPSLALLVVERIGREPKNRLGDPRNHRFEIGWPKRADLHDCDIGNIGPQLKPTA